MMRSLREDEQRLLQQLAKGLPDKVRDQVLKDGAHAQAQELGQGGSRLLFSIPDYERPTYRGQHPFPVEARMSDADGVELTVAIYSDENGRLLELEFVRWGEGEILGPQLDTLQVW